MKKRKSFPRFPFGADGRAVYGHVITKFSGMGRFTYPGVPLARFAPESFAINPHCDKSCFECEGVPWMEVKPSFRDPENVYISAE